MSACASFRAQTLSYRHIVRESLLQYRHTSIAIWLRFKSRSNCHSSGGSTMLMHFETPAGRFRNSYWPLMPYLRPLPHI
jgi:hypothetical protein